MQQKLPNHVFYQFFYNISSILTCRLVQFSAAVWSLCIGIKIGTANGGEDHCKGCGKENEVLRVLFYKYLDTTWCLILFLFVCLMRVLRHFQQYFSHMTVVSFTGGGSQSTWRKALTLGRLLRNLITCDAKCLILSNFVNKHLWLTFLKHQCSRVISGKYHEEYTLLVVITFVFVNKCHISWLTNTAFFSNIKINF